MGIVVIWCIILLVFLIYANKMALDPQNIIKPWPDQSSSNFTKIYHRHPRLEILLIALGTLLFSWPSLVNGGPFFISDSTAYIRSADAVVSTHLLSNTIWSDKRHLYLDTAKEDADQSNEQKSSANKSVHPPLMGRSVYYGLFLYLPVIIAGEHAAVFLQSAVVAIVVWLALFPWFSGTARHRALLYLSLCGVLAALTPLPFTVSLIVPDYLTGVACVSLVLLLCFWNAYPFIERMILISLVFFAAISHNSNLPLLLLLSASGALLRFCAFRIELRAILLGFSAVVVGIAGDATFAMAVKYKTGTDPIRPPFLTARLVAEGPGYNFLRQKCPKAGFEACRYVSRMPYDSDKFLWSTQAHEGVFSATSHGSQRLLSRQDAAFAIATLRNAPADTVTTTMNAAVRQLTLFNYTLWQGRPDKQGVVGLSNLPPAVAERMGKTLSVKGIMPVQAARIIAGFVTLVALMLALLFILESRRSDDPRLQALGLALILVLVALIANAAIAGGLSKPDSRYNLRVIWALPLFVGLYLIVRNAKVEADAFTN